MVKVELDTETDESLTLEVKLPLGFAAGPLHVIVVQDLPVPAIEVRDAESQRANWRWPEPIKGLRWDPSIVLDRAGLYRD